MNGSISYRCTICPKLCSDGNCSCDCNTYLFDFLFKLRTLIVNGTSYEIDNYFKQSPFHDEIDRRSYLGLTLMHANILVHPNYVPNANDNVITDCSEDNVILVCKELLNRGSSATSMSRCGMRPIHIALRRQWLKLTQVLLDAGADPNEEDSFNLKPLDIVIRNADVDGLKLLSNYGVALEPKEGRPYYPCIKSIHPLYVSFVLGHLEIFKLLLALGCTPNLNVCTCQHCETTPLFPYGLNIRLFDENGRRIFIQLLYEYGGLIGQQFKIHVLRYEPNNIDSFEAEFKFACDLCDISNYDTNIFKKWLCVPRRLLSICRIKIRNQMLSNGTLHLIPTKLPLNRALLNYLTFENPKSRFY